MYAHASTHRHTNHTQDGIFLSVCTGHGAAWLSLCACWGSRAGGVIREHVCCVFIGKEGVWGQRVLIVCERVKGREQGSRKLSVSASYLFPRKEFIFNR